MPHGSILGKWPAKRGHLKPVGLWNSQEIMVKGHQWKVTLNGVVILDVDVSKVVQLKNVVTLSQSHLEFLAHGSRVEFRYLRVKELK